MITKVTTKDNYRIEVYVYNSRDYSSHVFVCNCPNEEVNSSNCKTSSLRGRDALECLKSDAPHMTREEVMRMFDF